MSRFARSAPVLEPEPEPEEASRKPIRIVLADSHAAMRQILHLLLDGESDFEVVAETDSLSSMMRHVRTSRPDVLVLDPGLPGQGHGIEALSRLHREAFEARIVMLTMNDEAAFARGALDNGAFGLVLKEMADSDLPMAVRKASRGRRYVSPGLAARLSSAEMVTEQDELSAREREVLRLIALGHTSIEIAIELGLSPRTIETHRALIHRKLALDTRTELVYYALEHDLLKS